MSNPANKSNTNNSNTNISTTNNNSNNNDHDMRHPELFDVGLTPGNPERGMSGSS